MGLRGEGTISRKRRPILNLWIGTVLVLVVLQYASDAQALQRHELSPGGGVSVSGGFQPVAAPPSTEESSGPGAGHSQQTAPTPEQNVPPGVRGPSSGTQQPQEQAPAHPAQKDNQSAQGITAHPPASSGGHVPAQPDGALPEEHQGAHGPALPVISPTPGVTFVETMVTLMNHELKGRVLGWRPNDLIIGRFTDDINNYQLGVLEAIRFTTLRLKDSLTRMGDADAYDPDLEQALNLFMNRATLFWFPSAETSYSEAVDHLVRFENKLKSGQRNFYYRVDNLITLLNTYKDLMGNVNRNLVRPVGWFESDDYFYYAKGVAHVFYEILRVVRVGYQTQLSSTLNALDIMDEIIHELYRVENINPWIILDADLGGFLANHRANLNAPLSEAAHLLGVVGRF